jgi:glycosyltransferase involved in cell wall biosynthesis
LSVEGFDAYVVILGGGREEARLRAQIMRNGLSGRIILTGFKSDVLRWLAAADLLVNPSVTEGLPNVVLEAMAVGVPVVATDVGGVSDVVSHDETGWLVPAHPLEELPDRLACAIRAVAQDGAQRTRFSASAQRVVLEQFSFVAQEATFRAICQEVMSAPREDRKSEVHSPTRRVTSGKAM